MSKRRHSHLKATRASLDSWETIEGILLHAYPPLRLLGGCRCRQMWILADDINRQPTELDRMCRGSGRARGMGTFERITLWLAAIVGTFFSAGSFYVSLAQPLNWWPFSETISVPPPTVEQAAPIIVPTWALLSFGGLGVALLIAVVSFRVRRQTSSAAIKHLSIAEQQFN